MLREKLIDWFIIFMLGYGQGRTRGGAPPLRVPPSEGLRGAPMEEVLLILHLLAFPFLRPGTVAYLGGSSPVASLGVPDGALPPPGKYNIKRKLHLKSNTGQWQRLRICLNSLLIQGEKSFSFLKRILHYTRCTMTESRLNNLALKASDPIRLSELSLLKKSLKCLCKQIPVYCSLKELVNM